MPGRAEAPGKALAGKRATEAVAMAAADAAVAEAKPMSGNGYKVQVARTAVTRAILKAAGLLKA